MIDNIMETLLDRNYTVESLLAMAARYEASGQLTLARVVFEDAITLEAYQKRSANRGE